MDFKLTDEEKLVQSTAAQFVKKELLTREGDYLRQQEFFLPPGDPPRRQLDPDIHRTLVSIAQRLGLWTLELPEAPAEPGSAIWRAFWFIASSAEPFYRSSRPAFRRCWRKPNSPKTWPMASSHCRWPLIRFTKPAPSTELITRYRPESAGCSISNSEITIYDPSADLFLLPAREQGTHRIGLFLVQKNDRRTFHRG